MAPLSGYPLFSDIQFLDQASVLLNILFLQVIQQASPLTHQLYKGPLCIEILLISLEVSCQVIDTVCEKSNLPFRGSCVAFGTSKLFEDFLFNFFR